MSNIGVHNFFLLLRNTLKEITFRFSISKSMLALCSRLLLSLAFRFFGRHMTRLRNWMCIHSFRIPINVIAKLNSSRKGYSLFLINVSFYNLHEMWSFFMVAYLNLFLLVHLHNYPCSQSLDDFILCILILCFARGYFIKGSGFSAIWEITNKIIMV